MGMGRREFLRLFGGALAALTARPTDAVAILDDYYVNWKLGVAFCKPQGWTFADVKEMGEVKAGQILDLDDQDLARELVASAELPILTISKDPLSAQADRFTPGVAIYLERFEVVGKAPKGLSIEIPPLENIQADAESCRSMLKQFVVTSPPKTTSISQCDAAEYCANFVFEHENMQPTLVRMRTLAIFQKPAFYTLRMYDAPTSEPDLQFDYTAFVDSIKMA